LAKKKPIASPRRFRLPAEALAKAGNEILDVDNFKFFFGG